MIRSLVDDELMVNKNPPHGETGQRRETRGRFCYRDCMERPYGPVGLRTGRHYESVYREGRDSLFGFVDSLESWMATQLQV